ncbi:MAG: PDZ domain-containing protein [Gemmatimonadales bacterium]
MRSLRRVSFVALALALSGAAPGTAAQPQRAPGWIGIGFELWTGDRGETSVIVTEVREDSPAAEAGIEVGDRLLTINDARTAAEFENLADRLALRVGDRVDIELVHDGRRREVSLRAAERPADFTAITVKPPPPADSMVESMFRAMDSLRVQILASTGARAVGRGVPAPRLASAPTVGVIAGAQADPRPVSAPFEFFVFRGEQHDSLRREMDALNQRIDRLRTERLRLAARLSAPGTSRAETRALESEIAELEASIEQVTRESADLRAAMAEAARVSAGFEYRLDDLPDAPAPPGTSDPEPFRPLTPYLLGSNRVAGAELVDLRPGLAEYFRVDAGVLVVDVAPGTPMATAGIQPGDVIVNLDRVPVRSVDAVRIGISRAGDTLPLTLVRQGTTREVLLRRR